MVKVITYDKFNQYPEITAAFSTRTGGVSTGIFESMNLARNSADDPENIKENYRRFTAALGTTPDSLVASAQTHTTNIEIVSAEHKGNGIVKPNIFSDVDGLMTNQKGVFLCLYFADCVPVYLYDPKQQVISLVHSGWKGTVGKISAKAVMKMTEAFGSKPEDVIVVIGPSICQKCYEVSQDLFIAFSKEFTKEQTSIIFKEGRSIYDGTKMKEQKYQLSLWKAIEFTLLDAGVKKENIDNPEICTFENHELFFSHRFTQGKRGNNAAVLGLK